MVRKEKVSFKEERRVQSEFYVGDVTCYVKTRILSWTWGIGVTTKKLETLIIVESLLLVKGFH